MDAIVVRLLGVTPPEENPDPNMIRAVAGSPGVYTGTARVVRSLSEAGDLEEGEVMVCEMTLPPWVPLFSIAGAIVSDVGGVLCHSAIVAREFDVPAVVGSQVGTTVIQTGQTITVDGTNGVVYLDGRSSRAEITKSRSVCVTAIRRSCADVGDSKRRGASGYFQSCLEASAAPCGEGGELGPHDGRVHLGRVRGARDEKPQSAPAMTFSRPTRPA